MCFHFPIHLHLLPFSPILLFPSGYSFTSMFFLLSHKPKSLLALFFLFLLYLFSLQRPRSCPTTHPMVRPGWLSTLFVPATTWTWSSPLSSVSMSSPCLWSTTASHRWPHFLMNMQGWSLCGCWSETDTADLFKCFWVGGDTPSGQSFLKVGTPRGRLPTYKLWISCKNSQQPKHLPMCWIINNLADWGIFRDRDALEAENKFSMS